MRLRTGQARAGIAGVWPVFMATGTLCIPVSAEPRETACARPPRFRAALRLPLPVAVEIRLPSKRRGFGESWRASSGSLCGVAWSLRLLAELLPHVIMGVLLVC